MLSSLALTGHLFALSGLLGGLVLAGLLVASAHDRESGREAARLVLVRLPLALASAVAFGVLVMAAEASPAGVARRLLEPGWMAILVFIVLGHLGLVVANRRLEHERPWLWSAGVSLAVVLAVGLLHAIEPVGAVPQHHLPQGPELSLAGDWQADARVPLRLLFVFAGGLVVAGAALPLLARRPAAVHVADLLTSSGALAAIVGTVLQASVGSWILARTTGGTAAAAPSLSSPGFALWIAASGLVAILAGVALAGGAKTSNWVLRGLLGAAAASVAASVLVRAGLVSAPLEDPAALTPGVDLPGIGLVLAALLVGALAAGERREG